MTASPQPGNPARNTSLARLATNALRTAHLTTLREALWAAATALLLGAVGCATSHGLAAPRETQVGLASYYGRAHDGRRTASGERFDMHAMTAAHPTLPFGTRVRVTNLYNGRRAVVRINDRGPHHGKRIIDLSYAAARELGLVGAGVAKVRVEVVGHGS